MATTGTADTCATGRRCPSGNLHAYRVRGHGRSAVVLWAGGRGDEPDHVCAWNAAGRRQVPVFATARQARAYLTRQGRKPATPGTATLELARVQHWLHDPVRRTVPPGAALDAWNFFEDLARGLDARHRLPPQGAAHDSAYERLFGGGPAAWTPVEQRAVLELLTAGVELWNSCPVITHPRPAPRPAP